MCPRGGEGTPVPMRQRRPFSAQFKARVVLEVRSGQKRAAAVCREYQLKPDRLSRWKVDCVTPAATVCAGDERSPRAEQRIAELERLVERLRLEVEGAQKVALLAAGSTGSRCALSWQPSTRWQWGVGSSCCRAAASTPASTPAPRQQRAPSRRRAD